MNESLDPKLRDFEKRLRTLRPLEVDLSPPKPIQSKPKRYRYFRNVFMAVSATVMILVAVIVFYAPQKQTVVETPESVAVVAITPKEPEMPVFSTVRSQLASLLNEMPRTSTEPTKRSDDPVIEITVSRSPVEPREKFSGILRGGSRVDFDPEKPFLF